MTSSAIGLTKCLHCGTRFVPSVSESEFCCAGCRFVNSWISRENLGRFYDLKGELVTGAVGNTVFEPADWTWVERLQVQAEAATSSEAETADMSFGLEGMSCLACAWLIEHRFNEFDGAVRIEIHPERGLAHMSWEIGVFSPAEFFQDLARFGYRATEANRTRKASGDRSFMARLGVCGAFALNTMAFTLPSYFGLTSESELGALFSLIALISATFAVLVGGSYFFQHAWNVIRERVLHIDLPIALGIIAAYAGSLIGFIWRIDGLLYVDFVATFVFLMLLGRWVQERALAAARRRLDRAEENTIGFVTRGTDEIPADQLVNGDRFRVQPGNVVPVTATVEDTAITISLEWITGEPEALTRAPGQTTSAGARILSREPAALRAREEFGDSILSKLSGQRIAPRDESLERVLKLYLIAVLAIALAGATGWAIAGAGTLALQVFISVLVVSCPCALGVAIPLVDAWIAARLKSHGVFVRTPSLWSRLRKVTQIAFDKTGTLTLPTPRLRNPETLAELEANELAKLYQLVEDNRHPVARSLHEALLSQGYMVDPEPAEVIEEPGHGVWLIDSTGVKWRLGKTDVPGASVAFSRDQQLLAAFSFDEASRPDAAHELASLRKRFSKLTVLSGDQPDRVRALTQRLGFEDRDVLGGLSPQDKADWLCAHDAGQTLFLGDGANDSLGFDAALCCGMPASNQGLLESKTDFVFLGRGLRAIRELLDAGKSRRNSVRLVLLLAVIYNAAAVALCLSGMMSPLLAAILMPLSSVAIIAIAARSVGGSGQMN